MTKEVAEKNLVWIHEKTHRRPLSRGKEGLLGSSVHTKPCYFPCSGAQDSHALLTRLRPADGPEDQPPPVYSPGLFCEFAPASFQVTGRELPKGRQNEEIKGTWPGTRAEGTVKGCVGASGLEFSCSKNK